MRKILLFLTTLSISCLSAQSVLDLSFNTGQGFPAGVDAIVEAPNQMVYVGGSFTSYDGTPANRIVRLNSDGTIDPSFNVGTGFDNRVLTIAVQADGKVWAGGNFTSYDGQSANFIIRLNEDGSIDNTLPTGGANGFDFPVNKIKVRSNGEIVVLGDFTTYNGQSGMGKMVILEPNGNVSPNFSSKLFGGGQPKDFIELSNGHYIVVGNFTQYDMSNSNGIVKISGSGTRLSFGMSGFGNYVNSIAQGPDGKIYVGGEFTSYNDVSVNRLVCIDENLNIDTTFNIGTGASSIVQQVAVDASGKVYVGGNSTIFNSQNGKSHFVVLNPDGSFYTINNLKNFNDAITTLTFSSSGKIYLGGIFTKYDGSIDAVRIARLNYCTHW